MDKNTQGRRRGVAQMLRDAKEEITALADFPEADWREVWSTNPLERLNREVKRRTDVGGIFPNAAALHRISACVLIVQSAWSDPTAENHADDLHHSTGLARVKFADTLCKDWTLCRYVFEERREAGPH